MRWHRETHAVLGLKDFIVELAGQLATSSSLRTSPAQN